jgi:hypothetical protein
LLDVAVVAEGQGRDAHDAGLSGAEAGGLDVDDGPACASLVCRPAPARFAEAALTGWRCHILRIPRHSDKPREQRPPAVSVSHVPIGRQIRA